MTCVKCANRIEKALTSHSPPVGNVKVDFITNKVVFSIAANQGPDSVAKTLDSIGYKVKKVSDVTQVTDENKRVIRIKVLTGPQTAIQELFDHGIDGIGSMPTFQSGVFTITYNPLVVRGSQIVDMITELRPYQQGTLSIEIENPYEDDDETVF